MNRDKSYIENLFRNYKRNIARLRYLNLNLVSDDDDDILRSVNYTNKLKVGNIQTSNLNSLDNIIIRREQEKIQLEEDIALTEILLDSLDSRKDEQYKKIIQYYYIENMTQKEVMKIIELYDRKYFFKLCNTILNSLIQIVM